MKIFLLLFFTFCFSATSCQVAENTAASQDKQKIITTEHYEKDGISFSYPANWKITKDEIVQEAGRILSVEGNKNDILIITLLPSEISLDLDEYAEEVKKGWNSKLVDGEVSEFKSEAINKRMQNKDEKGIRLKFQFEKDSQIQELFLSRGQKKLILFAAQSVDNDWQNANKGFQMIFDSLKLNLDK